MEDAAVHDVLTAGCWDGAVTVSFPGMAAVDGAAPAPGVLFLTDRCAYCVVATPDGDAEVAAEELLDAVTGCAVAGGTLTLRLGPHLLSLRTDAARDAARALEPHLIAPPDEPQLLSPWLLGRSAPAPVPVGNARDTMELEETAARGVVALEASEARRILEAEGFALWRAAATARAQRELQAARDLHCAALKVDALVPDAPVLEPPAPPVRAVIDDAERHARLLLGRYHTPEHLALRQQRQAAEAEAVRHALDTSRMDWASEKSALLQRLAQLQDDVAGSGAALAAARGRISELQGRERAILERARRREEDLLKAPSAAPVQDDAAPNAYFNFLGQQ